MSYTTSDFLKNFNSNNIASIVTRFFDEIMVLYNLVGYRQDDIDICTDDESSVATFMLLMDSADDAKKLYERLNGTAFSVYEDTFEISMQLSNETITTVITKIPS